MSERKDYWVDMWRDCLGYEDARLLVEIDYMNIVEVELTTDPADAPEDCR